MFTAICVIIVYAALLFFVWCLCKAAKIGDYQFEENTSQTPAPADEDPPRAA